MCKWIVVQPNGWENRSSVTFWKGIIAEGVCDILLFIHRQRYKGAFTVTLTLSAIFSLFILTATQCLFADYKASQRNFAEGSFHKTNFE